MSVFLSNCLFVYLSVCPSLCSSSARMYQRNCNWTNFQTVLILETFIKKNCGSKSLVQIGQNTGKFTGQNTGQFIGQNTGKNTGQFAGQIPGSLPDKYWVICRTKYREKYRAIYRTKYRTKYRAKYPAIYTKTWVRFIFQAITNRHKKAVFKAVVSSTWSVRLPVHFSTYAIAASAGQSLVRVVSGDVYENV